SEDGRSLAQGLENSSAQRDTGASKRPQSVAGTSSGDKSRGGLRVLTTRRYTSSETTRLEWPSGTVTALAPASRVVCSGTTQSRAAAMVDTSTPGGNGPCASSSRNRLRGNNCHDDVDHSPSVTTPASAAQVPRTGVPIITSLRTRVWPPSFLM